MRILGVSDKPFHSVRYSAGEGSKAPEGVLPFYRAAVEGLPECLRAIVAASDLQGVVSAREEASFPILLGEILAREIDFLRERGDLPAGSETGIVLGGDLHPGADVADIESVWFALGKSNRWVIGVAGNHDSFAGATNINGVVRDLRSQRLRLLDGEMISLDGIKIAGLSGIAGSREGQWRRDVGEFAAVAKRLVAKGPDIFISHDGPNVSKTELSGWPAVREAFETGPRTVLIRGHDHWPTILAELANGTQVLNVEGRVVVLMARS